MSGALFGDSTSTHVNVPAGGGGSGEPAPASRSPEARTSLRVRLLAIAVGPERAASRGGRGATLRCIDAVVLVRQRG